MRHLGPRLAQVRTLPLPPRSPTRPSERRARGVTGCPTLALSLPRTASTLYSKDLWGQRKEEEGEEAWPPVRTGDVPKHITGDQEKRCDVI